jgi:hypothetical protein
VASCEKIAVTQRDAGVGSVFEFASHMIVAVVVFETSATS